MKQSIIFISILSTLLFSSCEKWLDVGDPKNAVKTSLIFEDEASLQAAVAGMYNGGNSNALGLLSLHTSMLADDLDATIMAYDQYTTNSLESNESTVGDLWSEVYVGIYRTNAILDGVPTATFSDAVKNQALGEAFFLRSFYYFYMVNLFGEVPLIKGIDRKENEVVERTPVVAIYKQIVEDLQKSIELLPVTYPVGKIQRTRVNKWAATALLARVYLYLEKYKEAEELSTEVIKQTGLYSLSNDLGSIFIQGNKEDVIFAFDVSHLGYTTVGMNTVPTSGSVPSLVIHPSLLSLFENGDARKAAWVGTSAGYAFPFKYKVRGGVGNEFDVVLRLSEQYLIRAEARAHLKDLVGAKEDLNKVRQRAKLGEVEMPSQEVALSLIERERRVEYFAEWGHRWLDLKRTNRVDEVIGALKPEFWEKTDVLYPIPNRERQLNPNLSQNEGYD
ncbi:RagB/SusD family nutrient uptake outer membrane protein [Sphingobacterium yanglingense]|uniref:RagB/SusD domain-containing protein n=1 Tax=Sphingobacterium yanglingense TaxID=1437280 RepID=A0A4V3DEF1_9SPHI|nr:RagB/SusD family nutrient uptake outer membrane protein [Sphingobacterium yanglingense]TDQ80109.1 RagB/SusD domain-containing protein [Sphingobacterium yanglingense]